MAEIIVPVNVGLRGDVRLVMRNVVTGEIETREMQNTILGAFLNKLFNGTDVFWGGMLAKAVNCRIGTSDQTACRSDTGIMGTLLASASGTRTWSGVDPVQSISTSVFPAGIGTGTVKEVVLCGSYSSDMVARQVVSPALTKTAQHELTVVWTVSLSRGANSWSGTFTAGQRDGTTDIDWVATINNKQLAQWADLNSAAAWANGYLLTTGTSNAASDLVNDAAHTIKGTQIANLTPTYREGLAYTADTFYRDVRVGLETTESNGAIGELLFRAGNSYLSRITFTPALDKVDTYRLYLTFRLAVVNAT